jgi:hypothetical protein
MRAHSCIEQCAEMTAVGRCPRPDGAGSTGPGAVQRRHLIISKWTGHYDSAFAQKTYVHASEEDLQRGQAALARIHKIA